MVLRLLSILFCASLLSCDSSTTTPKPDPEPEDVVINTDHLVEINQDGFQLKIGIPKDYKENNEVKIRFDEGFGHLEVICGDVFSTYIIEDIPDVKAFEEKLKIDLLMKYEIIEAKGNSILYKQSLPDGSKEFWHYYVGIDGNGTQYIARDNGAVLLNEFQATKIFNSIMWNEGDLAKTAN